MAQDRALITDPLGRAFRMLSAEVAGLGFCPPVSTVYNPLDYAWAPFERYLELGAREGQQVLLLGMNPGPWGMAQTGVPFGSPGVVREWLGIEEAVQKPAIEHPSRPVLGFDSPREEVSGNRLWGWARERFTTPQRFFDRFFIANYCPLVFMEDTGRNRTPDKLPAAERRSLFSACNRALEEVVRVLRPVQIVGIGKFAEDRARAVFGARDIPVGRILHPSPASPVANRGWAPQAERQLLELGVGLQ